MNKDNAKDYLPLVQALVEGKEIQFRNSNGQWVDCENPAFCPPSSLYRIKPEPKKQSYRVALYKDHESGFFADVIDNYESDITCENNHSFVRWLTDRIEYTLPEGDA